MFHSKWRSEILKFFQEHVEKYLQYIFEDGYSIRYHLGIIDVTFRAVTGRPF